MQLASQSNSNKRQRICWRMSSLHLLQFFGGCDWIKIASCVRTFDIKRHFQESSVSPHLTHSTCRMASAEALSALIARSPATPDARLTIATPAPVNLDADQVRNACTAPNTKKAYRSYTKGLAAWIRQTQSAPDTFFEEDGSINLAVFLPSHFEDFLLHKINSGGLKVSTLSGYRSALKDLYRQKRVALPVEYLEDLTTFFRGLKRVEADNDQAGRGRKSGKEPLTFSLYIQLAERTLALNDNGFSHLFLLSQWNLMCRSKSVETLHIYHLHWADDSVGCVLHKTKTNQEGAGPKDPRHIYANPAQPSCCWVLALGVYLASTPTLEPGKLFPGSNQKSRFCKAPRKLLEEITGQRIYGTHSIRKGVATYASSGSTGGAFNRERVLTLRLVVGQRAGQVFPLRSCWGPVPRACRCWVAAK
jgi:hypothetical protein